MGYIGRLAFEKRPEVFVDAAKRVVNVLPQARAVLFGTGPMDADLRSRAGALGGRIIFHGDCPRVELAHAAIDCLVLTSSWEGFPNVILEAFASARPVVAVRMPATEEIIEHSVTGMLVEDSVEAISAAVKALLADPERAEKIGLRARERVLEAYSVPRMVASYERLYNEITGAVWRETTG
jgi:L-malate glycosyltransferase